MTIDFNTLHDLLVEIFSRNGSNEQEAKIVANHLVKANLAGHDSHGAGMAVIYSQYVKDGKLIPNSKPELTKDAGAIMMFDGKKGYGQHVCQEAMTQAIERAKKTGLCLMTLRNAAHIGRIGFYGEMAVDAGLISIHFVNVVNYHPLVAPFAGIDARTGTNPICISIPQGEKNPPFILDFATSTIALGKTRVAWLAGTKFDENVMVTADGQLTNDPKTMWEKPIGALTPFAKHKGGGLVLASEMLAGILTGGGVIRPENSDKEIITNNITTILINPEQLVDSDFFKKEYDDLLEYVRTSTQYDPNNNPILIAGEPERIKRREREANGIFISEQEWNNIVNTAANIGVDISKYTNIG